MKEVHILNLFNKASLADIEPIAQLHTGRAITCLEISGDGNVVLAIRGVFFFLFSLTIKMRCMTAHTGAVYRVFDGTAGGVEHRVGKRRGGVGL
jgi:hypothetical protein